jgi:redox-sensitive bicupin YhaK (pirin superfamily)
MKIVRKARERFHTKIDWLDSWHSFSFGDHYDPEHMGFGPLRVINEDRVRGGAGFPTHPHRDMEIITVVLEGALSHKDNTGGGSVIKPGDVQKMSAGTGILHSEFNSSAKEEVHLLQIWIVPDRKGVAPGYVQLHFKPEQMRDRFCLVAAPQGTEGIIPIYQDARLLIADLSAGKSLKYDAAPKRKLWVQMALGQADAGGQMLQAGDGLAAENESSLTFTAKAESKILLFDMGG